VRGLGSGRRLKTSGRRLSGSTTSKRAPWHGEQEGLPGAVAGCSGVGTRMTARCSDSGDR
jgi:hypothetical protein